MNLIQLVQAGFTRAGEISKSLQQAIALKQDKLPTNGAAGQFLANDLTWKTPASGGSSNITWETIAVMTGWTSGFKTDNTWPLQLGKDTSGRIYIRGALRNTSGNGNTNPFLTIPTAYKLKGLENLNGTYPLSCLVYSDNFGNFSTSAAPYIKYVMSSGVATLVGSTSATNNYGYVFPEQCLGFAANP
ncbi:hypothetical protein [Alkanindiges illinoisensis]|uniref:hypothetical protein n=1 Tax=Alkanindiges illinoisensis TaxID=197183 RepID=UPI000479B2CE|nr:hypothetical protein [Alkanindiges illinoisensis]